MRKAATWLMMLIPIFTLANNNDGNIFHKGDIEKVKQQAAQEGKLFFVDFYADYCYACKLMDETTFVNDQVKDFLKDRYIPYKVDILMDIDGISLKQQYNITVLPTILVFNSSGEVVARYERMLGPVTMIDELKKYDTPINRIQTGEPIVQNDIDNEPVLEAAPVPIIPNDVPASFNKIEPAADEIVENKIQPIDETSAQPYVENSRINGHGGEQQVFGYANPNTKPKEIEPKAKPILDERLNVSPSATFATKRKEYQVPKELQAEGLFQFTVKPYPNEGYGVQIGVFAQYGNVLREVQKLQKKFKQPILVNISNLDGVPVYKIIVGSFDTRREAVSFRRMMRKKESDGVIKDLASVKLAN
jgi:thiol-disulfide isomerase/thioredoxin